MSKKLSREASSAKSLFDSGLTAITALQIANQMAINPPKWMLTDGKFDTDYWRKKTHNRLRIIRDELEHYTLWLIHTISDDYFYHAAKDKIDLEKVKQYIPKGPYYQLAGLRRVTSNHDPIYLASRNSAASYQDSRGTKIGNSIVRAHQLKQLSDATLVNLTKTQFGPIVKMLGNGHIDEAILGLLTLRRKLRNL